MSEKEHSEFEVAEEVCRKFLAWDLNSAREELLGSIKDKLKEVVEGISPEDSE